jgi:glycosyltransferase involved in cell wall biosynthesis
VIKKTIAILGTRGIPASYSGFETSVQETAVRFVQQGYSVVVYCRKNHFKEHPSFFHGVELLYLPSWKSKFFDTITHTLFSMISVFFRRVDSIILYGVGNSLFIPFLRLRGVPVIAVVDGADWERQKWGTFAKWFLRFNRMFAVNFANHYVVDNEFLAAQYSQKFRKKATYIPYGANTIQQYVPEYLTKYGLQEREYIIFVGRFVKEKGIEILIKAFEQVDTPYKLVIVGDNNIDIEYVASLQSTKDTRIIFTGFVFGAEYESLLHKALFYVSASLLEGTSPSLLSAMSINGFALVSDLPENKEVIKNTCATFQTGNVDELRSALTKYLSAEGLIEEERKRTQEIVQKYYSWDIITSQFIHLMK